MHFHDLYWYVFGVISTYVDVDECAGSNPCPHPYSCENTVGYYKCYCGPGYNENNEVEICTGKPQEFIIILSIYKLASWILTSYKYVTRLLLQTMKISQ